MKIIAIDPGYDRLGDAIVYREEGKDIVAHSELIETSRKDPPEKRLAHIAERLDALYESFTPSLLAIETLVFAQNKTSALGVAEARGVALLSAGKRHLPVISLSPQAIKIAVTNYGKSDKKSVHAMVMRLVVLPKRKMQDDEIDAIAIGITALAGNLPK